MIQEQSDWENLVALIQTQRYEKIKELLPHLQTAPAEDTLLYHIVAAAQQLCSACLVCQDETHWHQWLATENARHEQELAQALETIATIAYEHTLANPQNRVYHPSNGKAPSLWNQHPLWQTLQSLLFVAKEKKTPMTNNGLGEKSCSTTHDYEFSVHLLGSFRVYHQGKLIENWPSRKSKSLFKYFILHRHQPIAKEVLMEVFWPESDPDAARNNLNVAIYALRQTLRQANTMSCIVFREGSYSFDPTLSFWVDVEHFETHLEKAQRLQKNHENALAFQEYSAAEALYTGDFLEEDRYEDWTTAQRMIVERNYLKILEALNGHYLQQNNTAASAAVCQKILKVDACSEHAHRVLMSYYFQHGQRHLALRQYHVCEEALQKDLDTQPSPETKHLYEQIRLLTR